MHVTLRLKGNSPSIYTSCP